MKILPASEYTVDPDSGLCTLQKEQYCPVCGHRLVQYGHRDRTMMDESGTARRIVICRTRCTNTGCRRIHHLLPEGLIPYKRYLARCVEGALAATMQVGCEDKTIANWRDWYKGFLSKSYTAGFTLYVRGIFPKHASCIIARGCMSEGWLAASIQYITNTGCYQQPSSP